MFSREGGCGGKILMENSITFNGFLLQPSFSMCLFDIYSVSPTRIYCLFSRINLVTLITKYLLTSVKDSEKFYHWIYFMFYIVHHSKRGIFPTHFSCLSVCSLTITASLCFYWEKPVYLFYLARSISFYSKFSNKMRF